MKNNKIYSKPKNGFFGAQNTPSKKDKVKNIFSWLLIGILCLTMCGSLLGTIAFTKDCKTAKADELTYTFNGSNIFLNSMSFKVNGLNPRDDYIFPVKYEKFIGLPAGSSSRENLLHTKYFRFGNIYIPQYTYGNTNVPMSFQLDISRQYIYNYNPSVSNYEYRFQLKNFTIYNSHYGNVVIRGLTTAPYECDQNGDYIDNSNLLNPVAPRNTFHVINPTFTNDYMITFDANAFLNYSWYGLFYEDTMPSLYSAYSNVFCLGLMRLYMSSPNFTCNVQKIEFGSFYINGEYAAKDYPWFYTLLTSSDGQYGISYVTLPYNYIRYYDEYNNYFEYAIPVSLDNDTVNNPAALLFQPRSYYTSNSQSGYNDGYTAGFNDSESYWKNDFLNSSDFIAVARDRFYDTFINDYKMSTSYKNAIHLAYEDGRIAGLSQGGQFNFTTMLSAAINAPLSAFKDMINFELLGVNLLGLFTGLFTVAFVLFVVRKLT